MLRVIVDTNVFISGVFFKGNSGRILDAWKDGLIQIVLSSDIYLEYERVFYTLAKRYPRQKLDNHLDNIASFAEFVDAPQLPEAVSQDPDDDKFIACALAANVPIIVSGDSDLLNVSGYAEIEVLTPRIFCDTYLRQT